MLCCPYVQELIINALISDIYYGLGGYVKHDLGLSCNS